MKRWAPRQLIALILGVMFALGTVASAVQAADMAVEMSTAAVMGAAMAPDGCGGDDEAAGTGSCVVACPSSFQAAVPAVGPIVLTAARATRPLGEFASAGRSSHPDPYPPKPVNLI
jgi:hypothetical protein